MRDCPNCRVPLHGYEEVCPACGAKQELKRGARQPYGSSYKPEQPRINIVPIVLVVLGFCVFLGFAMNSTWIGQLMRSPKQQEDPIAKMSTLEARAVLESELGKNLEAVGAKKAKMTWKLTPNGEGKPEERNADAAVELTVDTSLAQPDLHKQVIEPIKPYMAQAKVFTLNMNDAKSHAHWTYNVQEPSPAPDADAE